ncbi:MAG: hypothetical protein CME66_13715 [Halobacteriovoraceae bacterium]|nr:hypothetical protein [Halobacteriovoraceae bacterium]|tara:strand:+ start:11 stop:307 length:297 start_codon:yes stop_codon:yes gene_type:complete
MTTETYPEHFYSLSIRNKLGQDEPSSRSYISGLMSISARRSIKNNENPSKNYLNPEQRLEISKQIDDHKISESNVFYLKSYVKRYYPDLAKKMTFNQI